MKTSVITVCRLMNRLSFLCVFSHFSTQTLVAAVCEEATKSTGKRINNNDQRLRKLTKNYFK
jgi:hypothetical protein